MVNHIVMWNFKEGLSKTQRAEAGEKIAANLLVLKSKVPGVIKLEVQINELPSSNKDLALISVFESIEALQAYQVHPEHIKAGEFIKSVTDQRVCFDYEQ